MKHVIGLTESGLPEVIQVPDDFIECSVSGEWHPPSSFRDANENHQSRTNCEWTYRLSSTSMANLKAATEKAKNSVAYRTLLNQLKKDREALESSIPIQQMIDDLLELQKEFPDARVCVTQDGYYADGQFGWIGIEPVKSNVANLFSIGHSSQ